MKTIGEYSLLTPWQTAGSGSARWCFGERCGQGVFIKQFLRPVYPAPGGALHQQRLERCERFEKQKERLYAALSCVIGDTLVPVLDFFRFEKHYYAVSEAVPQPHPTCEDAVALPRRAKREILYDLAQCLQRLHMQGIVHADLKPEHAFVLEEPQGWRARLIDLDSGYLCDDPPPAENDMEGDPVYLAPEAFLRMTGRRVDMTPKLDTFAFGALLHRVWTGELPHFDHEKYAYLYEAALDGGTVGISKELPLSYRLMVLRMLEREPDKRPDDAEIVRTLYAPYREEPKDGGAPVNGLSRYMRDSIGRQ